MKIREIALPQELDDRLIEWARYFRDRAKFTRCHSIEGRFNPHAPGSWDQGWGDVEAAPHAPLPDIKLSRVLDTHDAVNNLEVGQRWSVTYGYCYPNLNRWMVLKVLRKYTGRRFTWTQHLDALEMGRMRVWAAILNKISVNVLTA